MEQTSGFLRAQLAGTKVQPAVSQSVFISVGIQTVSSVIQVVLSVSSLHPVVPAQEAVRTVLHVVVGLHKSAVESQ